MAMWGKFPNNSCLILPRLGGPHSCDHQGAIPSRNSQNLSFCILVESKKNLSL